MKMLTKKISFLNLVLGRSHLSNKSDIFLPYLFRSVLHIVTAQNCCQYDFQVCRLASRKIYPNQLVFSA